MSLEFFYSPLNLIERPETWNKKNRKLSKFDKLLIGNWKQAVEKGLFKYKLDECQYKTLESNGIKFVVQLNPQREFNRRKRQCFERMDSPFPHDQFNFTKMIRDEILMRLKSETSETNTQSFIAINISPIDDWHVLFIPDISRCLPQRMTLESLIQVFDLAQLSNHPGFRVGFNSIHAWASINHLHYHAMYLNHPLYIDEVTEGQKVTADCFLMLNPLPAFGFKIPFEVISRKRTAEKIIKVIDYLHEIETPYSFMITRSTQQVSTRAFLWPRKSTKDLQPDLCFDVGSIEICGQFPVKNKHYFQDLTFDKSMRILQTAKLDVKDFNKILEKVKLIL